MRTKIVGLAMNTVMCSQTMQMQMVIFCAPYVT